MSHITNLVVLAPRSGSQDYLALLNMWVAENGRGEPFVPLTGGPFIAGSQKPDAIILVGVFNRMDLHDFVELFEGLNWPGAKMMVLEEQSKTVAVYPVPVKEDYDGTLPWPRGLNRLGE